MEQVDLAPSGCPGPDNLALTSIVWRDSGNSLLLESDLMQISVRAFASYREAIGSPRITLTIPDGASPGQVWNTLLSSYPRLRALPQPFAFAVNDEYVASEVPLRPRDELVLVPPVSGGGEYIDLVETPIDINAVLRQVNHAQAGGGGFFFGTGRDQ